MEMGIEEVYKLVTESGKKIETTGNHPYLVKLTEGFVEDKDTQEGSNQNQGGRYLSSIDDLPKVKSVHVENRSRTIARTILNIPSISDLVKRVISIMAIPGATSTTPNQAADKSALIAEATLNKDFRFVLDKETLTSKRLSESNTHVNGTWTKVVYLKEEQGLWIL